jgi:hypothetical protein
MCPYMETLEPQWVEPSPTHWVLSPRAGGLSLNGLKSLSPGAWLFVSLVSLTEVGDYRLWPYLFDLFPLGVAEDLLSSPSSIPKEQGTCMHKTIGGDQLGYWRVLGVLLSL